MLLGAVAGGVAGHFAGALAAAGALIAGGLLVWVLFPVVWGERSSLPDGLGPILPDQRHISDEEPDD